MMCQVAAVGELAHEVKVKGGPMSRPTRPDEGLLELNGSALSAKELAVIGLAVPRKLVVGDL
jgi:hypothetical protein